MNRSLVLIALLSFAACGDGPTEPELAPREIGVVLNSTDVSVTLFEVADPASTRTVGLGPDGSPVSLAVRGYLAAVPLGIVPAVAVVDVLSGRLLHTVGLPAGSGATGVAFLNDSIALVANPGLGSVSPVNVVRGTAGDEIPVGLYPHSIVVEGGKAYVMDARLENWAPAGPSLIAVIDGATLAVVDEIPLTGENAGAAAVGPDGMIYVVNSGSWGMGNGGLSVVNPASGVESGYFAGFGDFPGSVAVAPDGRVLVGAWGVGIMVWDPATTSFQNGPDNALAPLGVASTSGLGFDGSGRGYALVPDCVEPSVVARLNDSFSAADTVSVGICPVAIAFTDVLDVIQ